MDNKETYIAVYQHGSDSSFTGSLADIMSEMNDGDCDPDDFIFYRGVEVEVKLEKKLTLVEKK